jgi:hypothetical protein
VQDITVSKEELHKALKTNLERHKKVLAAAMEGYRSQVLSLLEEMVAKLKAGVTPDVGISLPRPSDYTSDYRRVMKMLEMHKGETVKLDETMFAQYVMDQWHWRRGWMKMSSNYAAHAVLETYPDEASEEE